jgi:hypothetical protein
MTLSRVEPLEHRQNERAGFPAAGTRLNQYVATGQQIRNRPRLNGRERLLSRQPSGRAQAFRQLFECNVS